jgi:SH3-like domain-containing protein
MIQVALALALLAVTVPSDPKIVTKVSIVDDSDELRRGPTPRSNVDWLWSSGFFDRVVSEADKKGLSIDPVRAS